MATPWAMHQTAIVGCLALLVLSTPLLAANAAEASREALLELRADGAFEPALEMAETLLEEAPDDVDLLLVEGQLQAFLGDYGAALETLARARALAPDYLDIQLMQGRVHLFAADPAAALALLEASVPPDLERIDAQLLLGRAALAAGEPATARAAFAQAAKLQPHSGEAWLGLGDAALQTGSTTVAEVNFERALGVPETAPVARERLAALAESGRRFELTTSLSGSTFNNSTDDWLEGGVSLGWRVDDERLLTGSFGVAHRYNSTDAQAALTWNARLDETSGYLLGAAVAPGADFLPTWKLRAGYDRQIYDLGGLAPLPGIDLSAGIGFVEGSLAEYSDGNVQSFDVGIVQYGWKGRAWLTVKAGGSFGTDGNFDPSYGLRLDAQATPASRYFLGFGHAFDNTEQGMGTTQTYFAGVDHELTETLGLLLSLSLEDRENGVRQTTLAIGFRVRF